MKFRGRLVFSSSEKTVSDPLISSGDVTVKKQITAVVLVFGGLKNTVLQYSNIVSHHSNYKLKSPDEKDSHRMMANLVAAVILGFGRFVHGVFKFIFSVISSMA